MPGTAVRLNGVVSVVWWATQDSLPDHPKKMYDLTTQGPLLVSYELVIDTSATKMWVLEVSGTDVKLVRYDDGAEHRYDVPNFIHEWRSPQDGVPLNVWARAVLETHELACGGRRFGCGCEPEKKSLHATGLLA